MSDHRSFSSDDQDHIVAIQMADLAINAANIGLNARTSEAVQTMQELIETVMEQLMQSPAWNDAMKHIARKRITETMKLAAQLAKI